LISKISASDDVIAKIKNSYFY